MKLVVIEPIGVSEEKLRSLVCQTLGNRVELVYYADRTTDIQELIVRGADADIIVLSNLPFGREVIEGCRNLKLISVAFTGVDHIALDACRERGVTVCNCAGYSNTAVAELVFGMAISLYRSIVPCNTVVRQGGTKNGLVGFELSGKRFGIVGTGAIGLRVAALAQAFGCEVYAYSRTPKPETGITYVELDTLLSECDIVSLHVPLNDVTRGLIGERQLAQMKPSALLINTARGPVVDSAALAQALNEGRLAGAGVDVFEMEPPIPQDHPLVHSKNTLLAPHVAFATHEALACRAEIVLNNVECWINGNPQNRM